MNSPVYDVSSLFEMGAHLGHKKSRLHPKAKKYVHTMLNGVSIIDLTKTTDQLVKATKLLAEWAKDKKVVLFVGTKKTVSHFLAKACEEAHIPYVSTKWHSGTITNFESIMKNVERLRTLKKQKKDGDWDQYVKHERIKLEKEIIKLERLYGGLQPLGALPDALCIIDIKTEKNTLNEADQYSIPVVAVVDTNANPDLVKWPIVVNDDSEQVMQAVVGALIEAYVSNMSSEPITKKEKDTNTPPKKAPKEEKQTSQDKESTKPIQNTKKPKKEVKKAK